MESVVALLYNLKYTQKKDTNNHIAIIFLDQLKIGNFLTQKELASLCNVSEPVITIFCQKLGFSGYRQFKERSTIEYGKYKSEVDSISGMSIGKEFNKWTYHYSELEKTFYENKEYFEKLCKQITITKQLILVPSRQMEKSTSFICEYLKAKGVNCQIFNEQQNFMNTIGNVTKINELSWFSMRPVMFIFSGSGNSSLYDFLFMANKEIGQDRLFAITTEGQEHKINYVENKFIFSHGEIYDGYFFRNMLLEVLMISIFDNYLTFF
ncbi:hypothetical protein [Spiroplasma endosymbiont of Othius punctulatus]|uniref:hypothetical protein n=1 Tax=Spiroplasma endosymbiont of Othius punctulatus TaxID=3066289 RepID=UPI0030CF3E9D